MSGSFRAPTGFVRSAVVVAALGTGLTADGYTVANTVPNILYILLIGGGANAVFVPELVRAAKEHATAEPRTPTGCSPCARSASSPSPRSPWWRPPSSSASTPTTTAARRS
ncbi:lipid II flippase MurJ [Streptomyces badius]